MSVGTVVNGIGYKGVKCNDHQCTSGGLALKDAEPKFIAYMRALALALALATLNVTNWTALCHCKR